jgi:hypothetical protein
MTNHKILVYYCSPAHFEREENAESLRLNDWPARHTEAGGSCGNRCTASPINKGAWRMAFSNGQVTGETPGGCFASPVWQQLPETGRCEV